MLKIIETPRDHFQGMQGFIPTASKISYISQLLKAGFDTVEVGSFVSAKAIPQMRDTGEVLNGLDKGHGSSRIMVLVGNLDMGKKAAQHDKVDDLLFPFSVSETFLARNIRSDFQRSKETIDALLGECVQNSKRLIVYLTMGFGNPYGDPWSVQAVVDWAGYLYGVGSRVIPLSDILGNATPDGIFDVFSALHRHFPDIEFGFHLHAGPDEWYGKVDAAFRAGVRRFDAVTGGHGGCPMADDDLVSNLDTISLLSYCEEKGIAHGLDVPLLRELRLEM